LNVHGPNNIKQAEMHIAKLSVTELVFQRCGVSLGVDKV